MRSKEPGLCLKQQGFYIPVHPAEVTVILLVRFSDFHTVESVSSCSPSSNRKKRY